MELIDLHDYRDLLASELEARLRKNPRYSQRAFARDLQIKPHRLSEILSGKQGLSRVSAASIARRLGMTADERELFCDLVDSKHARSKAQKTSAINRLQEKRSKAKKDKSLHEGRYTDLSLDKFKLIADWYHLAIFELANLPGFVGHPRWIAKRIGIQEAQAKLALERLVKLGYATFNQNTYSINHANNVVPSGVSSEAVRSFHTQLVEKSVRAIQCHSVEEKICNSSIFAMDVTRLSELSKRVNEFWKEVFKEFEYDPKKESGNSSATEVYCMSIQAFRLSEPIATNSTTILNKH